MTIADDMRAAAVTIASGSSRCDDPTCVLCLPQREQAALATRLRAHADTIERVEREMRDWWYGDDETPGQAERWANALRGDKP